MDSKDKKATFKTAFKGFDKRDVVEYIRALSAKYDKEIKEKTSLVESGAEKLSEAQNKISGLESQIDELTAEKDRLKKQLALSEEKAVQLVNENKKLSEDLKAQPTNDEIALLHSEVDRLNNELANVSSESEKAKLEIADIVIKAEQISRKLRDEAVADANQEKAAIERQIVSKKSELMGINGEIERMKSVFADLYKKYVKE